MDPLRRPQHFQEKIKLALSKLCLLWDLMRTARESSGKL